MPDLSTITPVTREEEFLDRIARAAASPNLPEVDTSDNGDVLTVVSGEWAAAAPASELPVVSSIDEGKVLTVVDNSGSYEWAAAAPGGGGGALKITMSDYEPVTGDPGFVLDKTYTEISTAINNGIVPLCVYVNENDCSVYIVSEYWIDTTSQQEQHYSVAIGQLNFTSDSSNGVLYSV